MYEYLWEVAGRAVIGGITGDTVNVSAGGTGAVDVDDRFCRGTGCDTAGDVEVVVISTLGADKGRETGSAYGVAGIAGGSLGIIANIAGQEATGILKIGSCRAGETLA